MTETLRDERAQEAVFHGGAGTLFGLVLVNFLLTILTLGIYSFWGKTRIRHFFYSNTEFDGDRFQYHGTGLELFLGALKAIVLFVPIVAVIFYLATKIHPLIILAFYLAIAMAIPFAMWSAQRYRMSRTSWRSVHYSFRGRLGPLYKIFCVGWILQPLTLGLYYPRFKVKLYRYWIGNTYFGNTPLTYDGVEADLSKIFMSYWIRMLWIGALIAAAMGFLFYSASSPVGAGGAMQFAGITGILLPILAFIGYGAIIFNWIWYYAAEHRYQWGHIGFQDTRFYSNMEGGALVVLHLVHALVAIVTLGFGFGWILVDQYRFSLSRIRLVGYLDFEQILQDLEGAKASGAIGEGVADALDVGDFGIELG